MRNVIVCISREELIHLTRYRAAKKKQDRKRRAVEKFVKDTKENFFPNGKIILMKLTTFSICILSLVFFIKCPSSTPDDAELKFILLLQFILTGLVTALPQAYFYF